MTQKRATPAVRLDGPVRITIPAAVAYDLPSLKETITAVVERLGCGKCFSGADCTFQLERDLVIDAGRKVQSGPRGFSPGPDGEPARGFGRAVTASLANEVSHDLTQVLAAVGKIVDKLGCGACCSGFDIAFREELDVIRVEKDLNVQTFGRSF
jgi:hypothetical protein